MSENKLIDFPQENQPVIKYDTSYHILSRRQKSDLIAKLIEDNKNLAPQGSDEWKEMRLKGIGASEVAALVGVGYSTPAALMAQKLGFEKFAGNLATYWGNTFEEVNRQFNEEKFKCDIFETGSIPKIGSVFAIFGFIFEVIEKKKHQITKIKISKLEK